MSRYRVVRPTGVGVLSRGKDFSVKDLGGSMAGYTDLLRKELGVSLDAEAGQTRWTQLHELSHVKHSLWAPDTIVRRMARVGKVLSVPAVLAAEDARINELLVRAVPDAHKGFVLSMSAEQTRRDLTGYVASHASPRAVVDVIRPNVNPTHAAEVDRFTARMRAMATADLTVMRVTVPLAELIERLLRGDARPEQKRKPEAGKKEPQPPQPGQDKAEDEQAEEDEDSGEDAGDEDSDDGEDSAGDGKPAPGEDDTQPEDEEEDGGGSDDTEAEDEDEDEDGADSSKAEDGEDEAGAGEAEDGDGDEDGKAEAEDEGADEDDAETFGKPDEAGPFHGQAPGDSANAAVEWVIPEVVEPPLTVPLRGGNAMVTTAEVGTVIRWQHAHRIVTDGVIFRRARRRPGSLQRGTVLIDASGSMSLSNEIIDAMMSMLPYATIAMYSGHTGVFGSPADAHLVILARNGRRVADLAGLPRWGGNACDGPALLWLSRQTLPRLWISDGAVWGMSGPGQGLRDECDAIMRSAGILQVRGGYDDRGKVRAMTAHRRHDKEDTFLGVANLEVQLRPVLKAIERGLVGD